MNRRRTHHLHLTGINGYYWRRIIAFRNYLKCHPDDARAYAQLKRELAVKYENDPRGYTAAKSRFVTDIEHKAGVGLAADCAARLPDGATVAQAASDLIATSGAWSSQPDEVSSAKTDPSRPPIANRYDCPCRSWRRLGPEYQAPRCSRRGPPRPFHQQIPTTLDTTSHTSHAKCLSRWVI